MAEILSAAQLNAIAAGSGYKPTGGGFSSVGLPAPTPAPVISPTPTPSYNLNAIGNTLSTASPVSILSSSAGQNIVNQNTSSLQKIESGYLGPSIIDYLNSTGQSSDFASRSKLAGEKGIANYQGTADQNTQLLSALRNVSSSPGSSAMVSDINKSVSSGVGMTQTEKDGLAKVQATQDALTEASAKARAALESKDYRSMDYWTAKAEENRKQYEADLADYYKSTKELRAQLTSALTPGAKEQELSKKLVDIRSQADMFKLQTEKDKLSEYEGQSLGFANGRANAIDFKASFKNQEYALQEKNLLLSLGLEQDARKMQGEAAKTGLGFLADDFDLQTKVQEKLDAQEESLFNKADKLETESKNTLISMLDALQGVDPTHLDSNSLASLETMAARANIPFDLVKQALQTQYNKQVFDQSLKNDGTGSGLTPYQTISARNQIEDNLRQNTAVQAFGQLVNFGVPTVIDRFNSGDVSNISDTILMRSLAKVTDPSTGVREEEYRTFEDATGALNKIYTLPKKWVGQGSLTAEGRAAMIKEIQDRYNARQKDYINQYDYYNNQAGQIGQTIPPPYSVSGAKTSVNNTSAFEKYDSNIDIEGDKAYIPASVWKEVVDKDGLLEYVKNQGYNLLVK